MIFIEYFTLRQLLPACVYQKKGALLFSNLVIIVLYVLLAAGGPSLRLSNCNRKSVNKINDQECIDGTTKEHNRPSKEHMSLIHNGAKYFLEEHSNSFKFFLLML